MIVGLFVVAESDAIRQSGSWGVKQMIAVRKFFLVIVMSVLWVNLVVPAQSEEPPKGGVPIGAEVAAAQSRHAMSVKLPEFTLNGITLKQNRSQPKPEAYQDPDSRKCPPFCVAPEMVPGATTIQIEDFPKMSADIQAGKVLVVDMRTTDWFQKGTIPGAIIVSVK